MPVQPSLSVRRRVGTDITRIAVRQVQGEEICLLLDPTDHDQCFAKIRLAMSRRMAQRHKPLLAAALPGTHIVFYNRVSASKSTLAAQPLKYPLGYVALFAWARFVLDQPLVNLAGVRIKLWPLDRCSPSVPRRFRVRQHLRDTIPADPKIPSNLTPAQPFLKGSVTNLQIQIHGEYPQTLPKSERAKVADFYADRDNTMPPLPWPSIAPPLTGVDSVRKDNHLICGQPVNHGLILGNKRSLSGFIGLCRQQLWFLIREPIHSRYRPSRLWPCGEVNRRPENHQVNLDAGVYYIFPHRRPT